MSEAESPFDVLPEIHDKFGRLHRFERDYLEELGPQGDLLSHRDLAMVNAGFRRGFAAGRTPGPATAQEVHQQLDFREGGATVSEAKKAAKQFEDRINNAAYNEEDTDGIDATIVDEIRSELRGSRAYIVAHVFLAGFAAGQSSHSENEPKRGS